MPVAAKMPVGAIGWIAQALCRDHYWTSEGGGEAVLTHVSFLQEILQPMAFRLWLFVISRTCSLSLLRTMFGS